MKNYKKIKLNYLSLLLIVFLFSCGNNNVQKLKTNGVKKEKKLSSLNNKRRLLDLTKIEFENKLINLGEVIEGDTILKARYIFKNVGVNPLLIEYVNPDCSCTDYNFTKEIVKVQEKGFIDLEFDIKNKIGNQKLYAIVKSNTSASFHKLILKVNILELN
ncbi:AIDA-I autotransporter [Polaribacter huanghezhanensis]|uniref:DUF1573 domain-containing protein n=1 Tax=Polaribacter huanghezhanensis TaxID=1354726 RepID=UPI0026499CB9|nr:DUF1573 domain-containing protein [Polaribacter huanghezhanensis]WKD85236.1 AIDA-I autotransporter [Polaribacter huanghezhanensis]